MLYLKEKLNMSAQSQNDHKVLSSLSVLLLSDFMITVTFQGLPQLTFCLSLRLEILQSFYSNKYIFVYFSIEVIGSND